MIIFVNNPCLHLSGEVAVAFATDGGVVAFLSLPQSASLTAPSSDGACRTLYKIILNVNIKK